MSRWVGRLNLPGIGVLLAVLACWELLVRGGLITFDYLPPPSKIVAALGDLAGAGLFEQLRHTTIATLVAWASAMVVGTALGFAIGLSQLVWRFSMASVETLRTVPVVALVPVALVVFGPGFSAETVIAAYAALWPVVISAVAGARSVPARRLDVGRQLQLSRWQMIRAIVVPTALPVLLAGSRVALDISLIVTVLAEMIGNPEGLGQGIVEMQMALQPEQMWAYVTLAATLGVALNAALVIGARQGLRRFVQVGA